MNSKKLEDGKEKLNKVTKKGKKIGLPFYLLVVLVGSIIGLFEAGPYGLLAGLVGGLLLSILSIVGIVPFGGIPIYLWLANLVGETLASLGVNIPISMTVMSILFGIGVVIVCVIVSVVVALLLIILLIELFRS